MHIPSVGLPVRPHFVSALQLHNHTIIPIRSGFTGRELQHPSAGVHMGGSPALGGDHVDAEARKPHDEGTKRDPRGASNGMA